MPGYVADEDLVDLYRSAWVVASTSLREGWGMTVTEAGACRTPSVATRIAGHQDAVIDGQTGMLVDGQDDLVGALRTILGDEDLRQRMGAAAAHHAAHFTWDATARGALAALGARALARP